jgi:SAM-dependent methyltransferase
MHGSMSNAQLFGGIASGYATFRPSYPRALFEWLAAQSPARACAWDCGCGSGSGQASVALAAHFAEVIATDSDAAQIAAARTHPHVLYRVASAENPGLAAASADLVTVAQALHWFDLRRFYAQVRRIARPRALLAVWTYSMPRLADPAADAQFAQFFCETLGPWWTPERRHVEAGYRTLPFPYEELDAPELRMNLDWTLAELAGYARSWSSTIRYRQARGEDPVLQLEAALAPCFGDAEARMGVEWPLHLRAGRAPGN